MSIYILGDSHALAYLYINCDVNKKITQVIPILSRTMFRVTQSGMSELKYKSLGILDNSYVVNVFGEIDARLHIHKQIQLGKNEDVVISELIAGYMNYILNNKKEYENLKCIVRFIVPPT